MSVISSGGYYTEYTGAEVDSAVAIALSLTNYTMLQGFSSNAGITYINGSQLTTPAQALELVVSGGYVTSSGASTIASGIVSGALTSYPNSGAVASMIDSAVISGVIDSAAVSTIALDVISSNNLQSSTGVNQQISAYLSGGGYTTSANAADIANSCIANSNLVDSATIISWIGSGAGVDSSVVSAIVSSSLSNYVTESGASVVASGVAAEVVSGAIVNSNLVDSGAALAIAQTVVQASGGMLVRVVDNSTTSALIAVLSGGTSYIYTQPLTALTVESVAAVPMADYIRFTLAAGASVSIPNSVLQLNSAITFEEGSTYLLGFQDGVMTWGRIVSA